MERGRLCISLTPEDGITVSNRGLITIYFNEGKKKAPHCGAFFKKRIEWINQRSFVTEFPV